jgi:flagellar basal-body rod modification protein FlgD
MNEIALFDKANTATGITGLSNSTMAKDEFLKLLVEQLKHQDPMSPMNSQDFASQLAQFSSLEQLTNMSGMMEESMQVDLMLTQAINNTMAASFIGKSVSAAGDMITFSKDGPVEISFQLNGQAENVIVNVMDSAGNIVKGIELGTLSEGKQNFTWDGKDTNGDEVPAGEYKIQVIALDVNGDPVGALTMVKGIISGIKYTDGTAVFVVNDEEIPFNKVIEITGSED